MSNSLGYFSDDQARDYPELNKCPDCETFFADETCPLCGKLCPEEFRAGNRAPVKQTKYNRPSGNGRVQFIPWYFSTWFIVLMMFVQPIVGLILVWMGPWRKVWKIVATVVLILPYIGVYLLVGLGFLFGILFPEEIPFDLDIPQAEYCEMCEEIDVEQLYRRVESYLGEDVTLTLTVKEVIYDSYSDGASDYLTYYLATYTAENGRTYEFLMHDYRQGDPVRLVMGDTVTFYGKVYGEASVYRENGSVTAPSVDFLYARLLEEQTVAAIERKPSKLCTASVHS